MNVAPLRGLRPQRGRLTEARPGSNTRITGGKLSTGLDEKRATGSPSNHPDYNLGLGALTRRQTPGIPCRRSQTSGESSLQRVASAMVARITSSESAYVRSAEVRSIADVTTVHLPFGSRKARDGA